MNKNDNHTYVPTVEQRANRREWVKALRSGDYTQARGFLRTGFGFCCLGVAETVRGADWTENYGIKTPTGLGDGNYTETAVLTESGMNWLGVVDAAPCVAVKLNGVYQVTSLTSLNDENEFTLAQIADVVEAQDDDWNGSAKQATILRDKLRDEENASETN